MEEKIYTDNLTVYTESYPRGRTIFIVTARRT